MITNHKTIIKQYATYILAFVGASYLLFSFIIPFLADNYKPLHRRITELYQYQIDPYNLIISIFFGFLGIYIAYQANLIAQRTLEQNRPKLEFTNIIGSDAGIGFALLNSGDFEATNIKIYYKSENDSKIVFFEKENILLSPNTSVFYEFPTKHIRSVIVLYQNALTLKTYILAGDIIFGSKISGPINLNSPIKSDKFEKILILSRNQNIKSISSFIENNF